MEKSNPKIDGFVLFGQKTLCKNWGETLAEVLKALQRHDRHFIMRFAPRHVGTKRCLVSQSQEGLYDRPKFMGYSIALEDGWWVGTHYPSPRIREGIEDACKVAGVKFGSELTLIER